MTIFFGTSNTNVVIVAYPFIASRLGCFEIKKKNDRASNNSKGFFHLNSAMIVKRTYEHTLLSGYTVFLRTLAVLQHEFRHLIAIKNPISCTKLNLNPINVQIWIGKGQSETNCPSNIKLVCSKERKQRHRVCHLRAK